MLRGASGENAREKLERIEEQVRRIANVTERLSAMDEVNTEEYVRGGAAMIDLGTDLASTQGADDENV